jgi:hypothetical protein
MNMEIEMNSKTQAFVERAARMPEGKYKEFKDELKDHYLGIVDSALTKTEVTHALQEFKLLTGEINALRNRLHNLGIVRSGSRGGSRRTAKRSPRKLYKRKTRGRR